MIELRTINLLQRAIDDIARDPSTWDQSEYGTIENPSCVLSRALTIGGFTPENSESWWLGDAQEHLGLSYHTASEISYFYPPEDYTPHKRLRMLVDHMSQVLGERFVMPELVSEGPPFGDEEYAERARRYRRTGGRTPSANERAADQAAFTTSTLPQRKF